MNTIKNIHKLTGIIPDESIANLEAGAALHLRNSNITFKIIKVADKELHVRTEQGKHLSENYATTQILIDRTRQLFSRFLPGYMIYTHPIPFAPSIVEVVTPEWLQNKMLIKKISIKEICGDSGIDKTNISAWVNGIRPMSQPVKAMFYFYFKAYEPGNAS